MSTMSRQHTKQAHTPCKVINYIERMRQLQDRNILRTLLYRADCNAYATIQPWMPILRAKTSIAKLEFAAGTKTAPVPQYDIDMIIHES